MYITKFEWQFNNDLICSENKQLQYLHTNISNALFSQQMEWKARVSARKVSYVSKHLCASHFRKRKPGNSCMPKHSEQFFFFLSVVFLIINIKHDSRSHSFGNIYNISFMCLYHFLIIFLLKRIGIPESIKGQFAPFCDWYIRPRATSGLALPLTGDKPFPCQAPPSWLHMF